MPNSLLHIGYPKAGSTYLQRWFEKHPQLVSSRYSVGGFPDSWHIFQHARRRSEPPRYYVTSNEGLAPAMLVPSLILDGKRMPASYAHEARRLQANICRTLHELFPSSKVLVTTRGYAGTVRSHYSEYVKQGGTLRYKEFLERFREIFEATLDYDYTIRLYADSFGEDNLLVLPYELLNEDAGRFLTYVEEALGLDHFEIDVGRPNRSLDPGDLYWYAAISRRVVSVTGRLRGRHRRAAFDFYVTRCLRQERIRRLVGAARRLRPGAVAETELPSDYLSAFRNTATLLRDNPLFARYAAEYLWAP